MLEAELGDRVRDTQRLTEVELGWPARRDRAKPAGARAAVAEDHERRRLAIPAIEDVGTARLFAHRVQLAALDDLLELLELDASGHTDADPFRDRRGWKRLFRAFSRMLPGVDSSGR